MAPEAPTLDEVMKSRAAQNGENADKVAAAISRSKYQSMLHELSRKDATGASVAQVYQELFKPEGGGQLTILSQLDDMKGVKLSPVGKKQLKALLTSEVAELKKLPQGSPLREQALANLVRQVDQSAHAREALARLEPDLARHLRRFDYAGNTKKGIGTRAWEGILDAVGMYDGDDKYGKRIFKNASFDFRGSAVKAKVHREFWRTQTKGWSDWHMELYTKGWDPIAFGMNYGPQSRLTRLVKAPIEESYPVFSKMLNIYSNHYKKFQFHRRPLLPGPQGLLDGHFKHIFHLAQYEAQPLKGMPDEFWSVMSDHFGRSSFKVRMAAAMKRGGYKLDDLPVSYFGSKGGDWLAWEIRSGNLDGDTLKTIVKSLNKEELSALDALVAELPVAGDEALAKAVTGIRSGIGAERLGGTPCSIKQVLRIFTRFK